MSLLENKDLEEILESELEKSLLKSACSHIGNFNDPFRGNTFALLMRELLRIVMERQSPNQFVFQAAWCHGSPWVYTKPNSTKKELTRRSRYRYAMTGPLSDELLKRYPQLDCKSEITDLISLVDQLSKFAHISDGTHTLTPTQSADFLHKVECNMEDFAKKFIELRHQVKGIVGELVDDELNRHVCDAIPQELDELSSGTRVEEVSIQHLQDFDFRSGSPSLSGSGSAEIELNYGGRGDDHFSAPDSYPLKFSVFIDPQTLGVSVESINVDTTSFYT